MSADRIAKARLINNLVSCWLCWLWLGHLSVLAQPTTLTDTVRLVQAATYTDRPIPFLAFIDSTDRLSFGHLPADAFSGRPQIRLMAGFTTHPVWCRFALIPPTKRPVTYLLQVTNWYLDEADCYVQLADGRYSLQRAGDQLPFSARSVQARFPTFLLTLNGPTTVYVRVRSTQHINLTFRLFSPSTFTEVITSDNPNFRLGLTIMRFVFHLALLLVFSDRRFRAYSYWGMAVCLAYICSGGNGNILFPHSPFWANRIFFLALLTVPPALTYFVTTLYEVPTRFPALRWLSMGVGCLTIVGMIASLLQQHVWLSLAMVSFFALLVTLLLGLALTGYVRGVRPPIWYLIPLLLYIPPYLFYFARNITQYGTAAGHLNGTLQDGGIWWAFLLEFLFVPFLTVLNFRQPSAQPLPPVTLATVDSTTVAPEPELPLSIPEVDPPTDDRLAPAPFVLTQQQQAFLAKLNTTIEQGIDRPNFDVEQLADAMSVSSRTLHRRLHTLTGTTARELIRTSRLQRAAQLLREGVLPVETAYRVGFDSPSSFSRAFRDHFGLSPSAYADANRTL